MARSRFRRDDSDLRASRETGGEEADGGDEPMRTVHRTMRATVIMPANMLLRSTQLYPESVRAVQFLVILPSASSRSWDVLNRFVSVARARGRDVAVRTMPA